jgi:hypothetical protein
LLRFPQKQGEAFLLPRLRLLSQNALQVLRLLMELMFEMHWW